MTENEAIKIHIGDCEKRIERIKGFMESNCDADISECCRNVRVLEKSIQALEEIQAYRAIGTVEECRIAVERMKPKKAVKDEYDRLTCPNCTWIVYQDEYGGRSLPCCENCGQAIDWSE